MEILESSGTTITRRDCLPNSVRISCRRTHWGLFFFNDDTHKESGTSAGGSTAPLPWIADRDQITSIGIEDRYCSLPPPIDGHLTLTTKTDYRLSESLSKLCRSRAKRFQRLSHTLIAPLISGATILRHCSLFADEFRRCVRNFPIRAVLPRLRRGTPAIWLGHAQPGAWT